MLYPHKKYYSVEEYLALEEKAEYKSEYHDGEIVMMSGSTPAHSLISINLTARLKIVTKGSSCRPFDSNMRIRIESRNRFLYADASVACNPVELYQSKPVAVINPLIIFEILSESTERYDRNGKFRLYRTLPSLQAYVLIEQSFYSVQVFRKNLTGGWEFELYDQPADEIILPNLLDSITVADLYDDVTIEENGDLPTFPDEDE